MCLGCVGALRGRRSSCCFTSQLHRQPLTCLQSCTPWSVVPAALSSANLISVKKQFNPRWAQSLRINTCNLSHYLSFLSAFFFACKNMLLKWPCVRNKDSSGHGPNSLFIAVLPWCIYRCVPAPWACAKVTLDCGMSMWQFNHMQLHI